MMLLTLFLVVGLVSRLKLSISTLVSGLCFSPLKGFKINEAEVLDRSWCDELLIRFDGSDRNSAQYKLDKSYNNKKRVLDLTVGDNISTSLPIRGTMLFGKRV